MLGELVLVAATLVADVRPTSAVLTSFHVIVNASNPVDSISRAEVSAIFMKRSRRWPDRSDVLPVDQQMTARVRDQFSRSIHGKNTAYVTRYWQRLIFSGRAIPPYEAGSNAAVIEFVKTNRGAIGYVDAVTPLPDQVKVITVTR